MKKKDPTRKFVSKLSEHEDHGKEDGSGVPADSDCPCRGTVKQADCAAEACGFCSAAEYSK